MKMNPAIIRQPGKLLIDAAWFWSDIEQVDESLKQQTKRHDILKQVIELTAQLREGDPEGFDWILDVLAEGQNRLLSSTTNA